MLRTRIDERAARARIAVAVTRSVQRARAALATIGLADAAIALANDNIVAERAKFDLGKSTNFEVLRRQEELEEAKLRRVTSIADYLIARAEIEGSTGEILKTFAITVK